VKTSNLTFHIKFMDNIHELTAENNDLKNALKASYTYLDTDISL
jgi:hypothetical protein